MDPSRTDRLGHGGEHAQEPGNVGYLFRRAEFPLGADVAELPAFGEAGARTGILDAAVRRAPAANGDEGSLYWDAHASAGCRRSPRLRAKFLMFYAHVPAGFAGVADVRLEQGAIVLEERGTARRVQFKNSADALALKQACGISATTRKSQCRPR